MLITSDRVGYLQRVPGVGYWLNFRNLPQVVRLNWYKCKYSMPTVTQLSWTIRPPLSCISTSIHLSCFLCLNRHKWKHLMPTVTLLSCTILYIHFINSPLLSSPQLTQMQTFDANCDPIILKNQTSISCIVLYTHFINSSLLPLYPKQCLCQQQTDILYHLTAVYSVFLSPNPLPFSLSISVKTTKSNEITHYFDC